MKIKNYFENIKDLSKIFIISIHYFLFSYPDSSERSYGIFFYQPT